MTTSLKPDEFVALSHPKLAGRVCDDLVTVEVTTKTGANYTFPDMSLSVLREVLPQSGRVPTSQPTLVLVNVSAALLSIPLAIVSTIAAGTGALELLWESHD